jgi:two-component system nitrate/nitrite response regulator NarL
MKIALCEDHVTFSEALEGLLTGLGHKVVGRTTTPRGAVGPDADVCVVDLHFPGIEGCDAVDIVRQEAPTVPIVVLTARRDRELIEQAFDRGANGAVLKTEGIAELESVLRRVVEAGARGDARRSRPRVRSRQVQALTARGDRSRTLPHLTRREDEVLRGLVEGKTTAQIATSLGVEITTLRTHVQHILSKFGAHSRVELVATAMRTRAVKLHSGPDDRLTKSS